MTVSSDNLRFRDGNAYEVGMGVWSRLVGEVFLDWLVPPPAQRWLDVGCGNGVFTELLIERCAPASVYGIDPSEEQLAFARERRGAAGAIFEKADAMALPYENASFDAAAMALVLFFVPDPARAVAELARVVRPGGLVAAYVWDIAGGGLPFEVIRTEFDRAGVRLAMPPHPEVTREDALRRLWTEAGLRSVETTTIAVKRSFETFEAFWHAHMTIAGLSEAFASLSADEAQLLKDRVRMTYAADASGRVECGAHAVAIRGRP